MSEKGADEKEHLNFSSKTQNRLLNSKSEVNKSNQLKWKQKHEQNPGIYEIRSLLFGYLEITVLFLASLDNGCTNV